MTYNANHHLVEGVEPKYYARIPNMAVDDLNYAELALYVHYKRVASDDGACWQSTPQIAKSLGMSKPKLRKTRDSLVKKGMIVVTIRVNDDDIENNSRVIQIVDLWEQNVKRYTPLSKTIHPPYRKRYTKKNQ